MAQAEDRRRVTMRLIALQVSVVVAFAALAIGFWFLQVVQNKQYEEMAQNNHQRTLALRAPRGVLFDRNGRVLVENRHSFTISIVREHTKDLDRTVKLLAAVVGMDAKQIKEIVDRHRSEPSYRPTLIIDDASLAQVAASTARRLDCELPDGVVEEVPARPYPAQGTAAQVFGAVGACKAETAAAAPPPRGGERVARAGRGASGLRVGGAAVETSEVGREERVVEAVAFPLRLPGARLGFVTVVGGDAVAHAGQSLDDGGADAAGAAGHECGACVHVCLPESSDGGEAKS